MFPTPGCCGFNHFQQNASAMLNYEKTLWAEVFCPYVVPFA